MNNVCYLTVALCDFASYINFTCAVMVETGIVEEILVPNVHVSAMEE